MAKPERLYFIDDTVPCNVRTAITEIGIHSDSTQKNDGFLSAVAAIADVYTRMFGKVSMVSSTISTKRKTVALDSPNGDSNYFVDLDQPHIFIKNIKMRSLGNDSTTIMLQGAVDPMLLKSSDRPFMLTVDMTVKGIEKVHELTQGLIPFTVIDIWDSMLRLTRTSRIKTNGPNQIKEMELTGPSSLRAGSRAGIKDEQGNQVYSVSDVGLNDAGSSDSVNLININRVQNIRQEQFLKQVADALNLNVNSSFIGYDNPGNADAPVEIFNNFVNSVGQYTFIIENIAVNSVEANPDLYDVTINFRQHAAGQTSMRESLIREKRGAHLSSITSVLELMRTFMIPSSANGTAENNFKDTMSRIHNKAIGNMPAFTKGEMDQRYLPVKESNVVDLAMDLLSSDLMVMYALANVNLHLRTALTTSYTNIQDSPYAGDDNINNAPKTDRGFNTKSVNQLLSDAYFNNTKIKNYLGLSDTESDTKDSELLGYSLSDDSPAIMTALGVGVGSLLAANVITNKATAKASQGVRRFSLGSLNAIGGGVLDLAFRYFDNKMEFYKNQNARTISLPSLIMNTAPNYLKWLCMLSSMTIEERTEAIKVIATLSLEITTAMINGTGINNIYVRYGDKDEAGSRATDTPKEKDLRVVTLTRTGHGTITSHPNQLSRGQIFGAARTSIMFTDSTNKTFEYVVESVGRLIGDNGLLTLGDSGTIAGSLGVSVNNLQLSIMAESCSTLLKGIKACTQKGVEGAFDAATIVLGQANTIADLVDTLIIHHHIPQLMVGTVKTARDIITRERDSQTFSNVTNINSYNVDALGVDGLTKEFLLSRATEASPQLLALSQELLTWVEVQRGRVKLSEKDTDLFLLSNFSGFSDVFNDSNRGKQIALFLLMQTVESLKHPVGMLWYRLFVDPTTGQTTKDLEQLQSVFLNAVNLNRTGDPWNAWKGAWLDFTQPANLIVLALLAVLAFFSGIIATILTIIVAGASIAFHYIYEKLAKKIVIKALFSNARMALVLLQNIVETFEDSDAIFIATTLGRMVSQRIGMKKPIILAPYGMVLDMKKRLSDKQAALLRSSAYMTLPTPLIPMDGMYYPLRPDFFNYYGGDFNQKLEEYTANAIDNVAAYHTSWEEENLDNYNIPELINTNGAGIFSQRLTQTADTLKASLTGNTKRAATIVDEINVKFGSLNVRVLGQNVSTVVADAKDDLTKILNLANKSVTEVPGMAPTDTAQMGIKLNRLITAIEQTPELSANLRNEANLLRNINDQAKSYLQLGQNNGYFKASQFIEQGSLGWYEYAKSLVLNDYGAFGSFGRDIIKTRMIEASKKIVYDQNYFSHGRSFPATRLFFIDNKGDEIIYHDDLYGYSGIVSIDGITKSRESATDYAVFTVSNYKNKLMNTMADRFGFRNPFEVDGDQNEELNAIFVKPGCKIQIRLGYDALLDQDSIVFNGEITSVTPIEGEQLLRIEAQSFGANLTRPIATDGPVNIRDHFLGPLKVPSIENVGQGLEALFPKVKSYRDIISWILAQKGVESPTLGPTRYFQSSFGELERDIRDFQETLTGIKESVNDYFTSIGLGIFTGLDIGSLSEMSFVGPQRKSSILENIRLGEDIHSENSWVNLINTLGGMFQGWTIYNESAWDAIWEVLNQIPNHALTVRNYDDRQTVVVGSIVDGYYKYTDRRSLQNSSNRKIITELAKIAGDANGCLRWLYRQVQVIDDNNPDLNTAKAITAFTFISMLERVAKLMGKDKEWAAIGANDKFNPTKYTKELFQHLRKDESLVTRARFLDAMIGDPERKLIKAMTHPTTGIINQLNIGDAVKISAMIYHPSFWKPTVKDSIGSDNAGFRTFLDPATVETTDQGIRKIKDDAKGDLNSIVQSLGNALFTKNLNSELIGSTKLSGDNVIVAERGLRVNIGGKEQSDKFLSTFEHDDKSPIVKRWNEFIDKDSEAFQSMTEDMADLAKINSWQQFKQLVILPDHSIVYSIAAQMTVKYFLNIAYSRSSQHKRISETYLKASGIHIIENAITLNEGHNRVTLTYEKDIGRFQDVITKGDATNLAKFSAAAGVDPENRASMTMVLNESIEPHTWKTIHIHQKNGRAVAAMGTRALKVTGSNVLASLARKYYDGYLDITLDPRIEPWDAISLYDEFRDMTGLIGVRRVTHMWNPRMKESTKTRIVPDLPSFSEYNIYNYTDSVARDAASKIMGTVLKVLGGIAALVIGRKALRTLTFRGLTSLERGGGRFLTGGLRSATIKGLQTANGMLQFGRSIRGSLLLAKASIGLVAKSFSRVTSRFGVTGSSFTNAAASLKLLLNESRLSTQMLMAQRGFIDGLMQTPLSIDKLRSFNGAIADDLQRYLEDVPLEQLAKLQRYFNGAVDGGASKVLSETMTEAIANASRNAWLKMGDELNALTGAKILDPNTIDDELRILIANAQNDAQAFNKVVGRAIDDFAHTTIVGGQKTNRSIGQVIAEKLRGGAAGNSNLSLDKQLATEIKLILDEIPEAARSPKIAKLIKDAADNPTVFARSIIDDFITPNADRWGKLAFMERHALVNVAGYGKAGGFSVTNLGQDKVTLERSGLLWNRMNEVLRQNGKYYAALQAATRVKATGISRVQAANFMKMYKRQTLNTWTSAPANMFNKLARNPALGVEGFTPSALRFGRKYNVNVGGFLGRPGYSAPSFLAGAVGLFTAYTIMNLEDLFSLDSENWEIVMNIGREIGFFKALGLTDSEMDVDAESVVLSGLFYKGQPMIANVDGMKKGSIVGSEGADTALQRRINYTRKMIDRELVESYFSGIRESQLYLNSLYNNSETIVPDTNAPDAFNPLGVTTP